MKIHEDIRCVGVNDHQVDLFEGQFLCRTAWPTTPTSSSTRRRPCSTRSTRASAGNGSATSAPPSAGAARTTSSSSTWVDHSANVAAFLAAFPEAKVVASAPAFAMMKNFFGDDYAGRRVVVKDGDTLSTGRHEFAFVAAPMVHWPEVVVTYDAASRTLFSADGFGKFGANDVVDPEGGTARRGATTSGSSASSALRCRRS